MMKFLLFYWVIANLIGLYVMYSDKEKAKRGQYRIKESTLWKVAVAGGAVGSYIGMILFRHKTKHPNFKIGFPLLLVIQVALLLYICNIAM